ncbi:MAG: hypothetical protein CM1200mP35_06530 [Chloroflexota bacterium]|nr:MAG: hypothetical protein CM1200mP35_06530 [Chloroflexota bacterium]
MLNRPQSLNAVNDQFEADLYDALLEFDIDEEAWVAIILWGRALLLCWS